MGTDELPRAAGAAGVLFVVSGGLTLLGGVLLFSVASLGLLFSALALVRLAVAVLEIVVGLAVQSRRPGARVRSLAVAGAAIVLGVLFLSRGGLATVGIVLPAAAAYLLCRPESRAAFGPEPGVLAGDLELARRTVRTAAARVRRGGRRRRPRP